MWGALWSKAFWTGIFWPPFLRRGTPEVINLQGTLGDGRLAVRGLLTGPLAVTSRAARAFIEVAGKRRAGAVDLVGRAGGVIEITSVT